MSQLDEKLIATTNEEGLIRTHGRLENSSTLRLKESYARSKANALFIGLRKMAKSVVSKCVDCRKLRKKPLQKLMGQLTSLRVAAGFPPFSNTAMDMFGPLQFRLNRRTLQDAQVVIFTCATTRAVHLELVTNNNNNNNNIHLYSAFLLVIQSPLQSVNT